MNTTLSYPFEDYCLHAYSPVVSLKPLPVTDHRDDDIHRLKTLAPRIKPRALSPLPIKSPSAMDEDRTVVAASRMRMIEHELRNDELDMSTVLKSCRGLTKGSQQFEDAYIAARIHSFAKHSRVVTDLLVSTHPPAEDWLVNASRHAVNHSNPAPPHPMAVNHLGHLMAHFGIWVIGLLGLQVLAAWRIGAFASTYLEGGRIFHFILAAFLMMALDSVIWFRRRGNLCNAFLAPGSLLYLFALLPVIILHVRETVLVMR